MPRKQKPIRGAEITFVKGKYAGEYGWINKAMPDTPASCHVIINGGQDSSDDWAYTALVRKTSLLPKNNAPTNVAEFVVQEDPKVAQTLTAFAQALAEAGLTTADDQLLLIVKTYVDLACSIQKGKGRKAKYSATALAIKDAAAKFRKRTASGPLTKEKSSKEKAEAMEVEHGKK